jgi:hypothetical protein
MILSFNTWQEKYNNKQKGKTMTKKKDKLDKWLKDHVHFETFSFNKKTKKQKQKDKQIQDMLHKKLKEDLIKDAI